MREIDDLSRAIAGLALCGLGQTAVNPVLTSFQYCRDEYQAHVRGKCPALSCKPLIDFEINTACKLCRACFVVCPTGAVKLRAGQEGRVFVDRELCSKCWACYETCPFGLIKVTSEEYPWLRK
ncbi:MAG: 4Fe-4S binding protein [Clostridia bacterium]|nr:4Fe-4S binding protein [Clostridia bacterium]